MLVTDRISLLPTAANETKNKRLKKDIVHLWSVWIRVSKYRVEKNGGKFWFYMYDAKLSLSPRLLFSTPGDKESRIICKISNSFTRIAIIIVNL
jgi:hypothetical protein